MWGEEISPRLLLFPLQKVVKLLDFLMLHKNCVCVWGGVARKGEREGERLSNFNK